MHDRSDQPEPLPDVSWPDLPSLPIPLDYHGSRSNRPDRARWWRASLLDWLGRATLLFAVYVLAHETVRLLAVAWRARH